LTLCLLVVMGALAWPQLDKVFSNIRLRKAADIVRTQWTKARIEAISSGCIRVFRYEVEGVNFRVEALGAGAALLQDNIAAGMSATDSTQTMLGDTASTQTGANTAVLQPGISAGPAPAGFAKTLPKDIVFVGSQTVVDTRAAAVTSDMAAAGNPMMDSLNAGNLAQLGANWSEPIFFYPDGTTSSARLVLRNKEGRTIELVMRGLTGVVKVGTVMPAMQGNP
jgi:Tfp pilus assembly protein FimT